MDLYLFGKYFILQQASNFSSTFSRADILILIFMIQFEALTRICLLLQFINEAKINYETLLKVSGFSAKLKYHAAPPKET